MSTEKMDLRGLKCPQPTLKMTIKLHDLKKGDLLEVLADCPTFETDLKNWCERTKKTILWIRNEDDHLICQIQI